MGITHFPIETLPCIYTDKQIRAMGIADHILPLGDWFLHTPLTPRFFSSFVPPLNSQPISQPLGPNSIVRPKSHLKVQIPS